LSVWFIVILHIFAIPEKIKDEENFYLKVIATALPMYPAPATKTCSILV